MVVPSAGSIEEIVASELPGGHADTTNRPPANCIDGWHPRPTPRKQRRRRRAVGAAEHQGRLGPVAGGGRSGQHARTVIAHRHWPGRAAGEWNRAVGRRPDRELPEGARRVDAMERVDHRAGDRHHVGRRIDWLRRSTGNWDRQRATVRIQHRRDVVGGDPEEVQLALQQLRSRDDGAENLLVR